MVNVTALFCSGDSSLPIMDNLKSLYFTSLCHIASTQQCYDTVKDVKITTLFVHSA